MKKKFLKIFVTIFLGFLTVSSLPGLQGKRSSQDINNLYQRIFNRIPPSDKNKVLLAVKSYEQRISSADRNYDYYSLAEREIQNYLPARSSSIDMSEAVFVVIVRATKDMDDDIRQIMDEIRTMTEEKNKMRNKIKELNEWISEEMSKHPPNTDDINLDKVSGVEKIQKKDRASAEQKFYPKMEITPNYKVKYYKSPVTKPNPNLGKLPLDEIKKRLQQSDDELKILLKVDEATRLALRPLSEKRNRLFQVILNLPKKK